MAKFIQFNRTYNSNKYYNVDAIIKLEKWHNEDTDGEDRITVYIQNEEPFFIGPDHVQWDYLLSLMEDFPGTEESNQ